MKSWRAISVSAATLACICCAALLSPRAARRLQAASSALAAPWAQAQQTPTIEDYNPKSTLVVPEHKIERAKYPFVDIHSHHWNPTAEHVDQVVKEMDTINLRVLVNLSGGTGADLKKTVAVMKGRHPDRFVVFANLNFDDLNTPGYGQRAAGRLEQDV